MPNHIENNIEIKGTIEQIKEVKEFMKSEDKPFDFNNLISIPKELKDTRSPMKIISQKEYDEQEQNISLIKEKIKKGIELSDEEKFKVEFGFCRCLTVKLQAEYFMKFGADNWYDWKIKNFNTKWGSYGHSPVCEDMNNPMVCFQTAWSHPYPIVKKLSKKFPKIILKIQFADEDFGYNIGDYEIKNGKIIKDNTPEDGSEEAYKLALEIQGCKDYHLYDVWEDINEKEKIIGDSYYEFCLKLSIKHDSLDAKTPMRVLKTALQYTIDNEIYEKSKYIQNTIDCAKQLQSENK